MVCSDRVNHDLFVYIVKMAELALQHLQSPGFSEGFCDVDILYGIETVGAQDSCVKLYCYLKEATPIQPG